MFEDSLMESGRSTAARSKYWPFVSLLVNGAGIIILMTWPLLHPEALPARMIATLMVAPSPPPAPQSPTAPAAKVQIKSEMLSKQLQAPSKIPNEIKAVNDPATPPSLGVMGMERLGDGIPGGLNSIIGSTAVGPAIVVKPASPKTLTISSGVMDGNLVVKTLPQYPAIPRAAHIHGTVVLQATITKTGSIQNLRVISGPPMLQQAAIDAVRTWRYRPYLLNGEPVEVETTVNIIFNLGD